jgi:hypothetical protein
MVDDLYWVFTLDVKPGRFQEFRALVADIVPQAAKNPALSRK